LLRREAEPFVNESTKSKTAPTLFFVLLGEVLQIVTGRQLILAKITICWYTSERFMYNTNTCQRTNENIGCDHRTLHCALLSSTIYLPLQL
jgi:hypothetical protein